MNFLNASLLGGAALIAVPIVLHLIMRQRPKLLEFPAMRFVQKRHDSNQRRLRLRHLLLLLLRAGAIALLALALARPTLDFAGGMWNQESPVAAALVFDTAPHMAYRHENKTRLEVARELGLSVLAQMPRDSQTAVLDTGLLQREFDADRGLSRRQIERLDVINQSQPLARAVGEAARVLAKSELPRKEIYVFTDLSRAAWPSEAAAAIQDRLSELHGAAVYILDVGILDPKNVSLGELRLSQQVLSRGGTAEIQTDVSSVGAQGDRNVEFYIVGPDGKPQKRDEETVNVKSGEARPVSFDLSGSKNGIQQGFVRLVGQDSMAGDDMRFFSVEVRPAWPVLVVAPQPEQEHAIYLTGAVAPPEFRLRGQARFDCRVIDFKSLADLPLETYAAVCLLDPPRLEPGVWQKLAQYASDGHGVAVFLGRNAQSIESFNGPAAQQLLPGKLNVQVPRREGDTYLAPSNFQHPILKPFRSRATSTPWNAFPVFRYWELGQPPAGVGTVISYNDGRPALLERPIGAGRVLVMTTPISDRPNRDAWNLLPVSPVAQPWPFVILMNQIMSYLTGDGQQQLNYLAGNHAVLPLDDPTPRRTYVLTAPDGIKTTLTAEKRELVINSVEQVGNYQVQSGGRSAGIDLGFSVNLAPQQTELTRIDEKQLAELFGPFKFQLLRSTQQIERSIGTGTQGRELYPLLIALVAIVLAAEFVTASRFYKQP